MKIFVKRDLDGFCALFVDNLVQILLIVGLGVGLCGMSSELMYKVVLPGVGISILVGNLFYAWQAHRLAKKTGRDDVTALPYGINTVSLLVFVFFIIKPEFDRTGDPVSAWKMGVLACLGSGIIELIGAFVAGPIRRNTPRAALLSTLAGIAIGFISMTFALQIFSRPMLGLLPLAIVLVGFFSNVRLPFGIPGGLCALLVGTAAAWLMVPVSSVAFLPAWLSNGAASVSALQASFSQIGWCPPVWCGNTILEAFKAIESWGPFLSVVIPMGIFNIIGSMQNIESAEAAGDSYPTMPSMAANGVGTIVAALFGSCFPTTIYIGHPGWKELGARAGYSTLSGLVSVIIALTGFIGTIAAIIPVEAGAAIVLWIGIIITAQAFHAVPREHAPAVAMGFFPAVAAWGATIMLGTLVIAGGSTLQEFVSPQTNSPQETSLSSDTAESTVTLTETDTAPALSAVQPNPFSIADAPETTPSQETAELEIAANPEIAADSETAQTTKPAPSLSQPTRKEVNGFLVHGLLLMERGYIFTCMILAATTACLIDRKFRAAAIWMLIAAACTGIGIMHTYQIHNGFVFDHLFRFSQPVQGAFAFRADDITTGYLLAAAFFGWLSLRRSETDSQTA